MTDFDFRGRYRLQYFINYVLPTRKFPLPYTLYGGENATWWTITSDCARYILKFIKENSKVRRFAKFTWASDEFLIPTIIMNSPFKDSVVQDNFRYIDWSLGGHNPKILTIADFEHMRNSKKLFARKFDPLVDSQVLDQIDKASTI